MRTLILTLVVGLAAVASGGHTALSAHTANATDGIPFLVKGGEGHQVDSHLSGSLIVFTDRSTAGSFIRYRDLADPGSALQTVPGDGVIDLLPDVAGTEIVFTRLNPSTSTASIVWFDTANPSLAPIELSPAPHNVRRREPAIGGDTVAFEQYTTSPARSDVCVSSVSAPLAPETCLTTDGTTVGNAHPAVSPDGNTVVWQKCASSNVACDLYIAHRNEEGAWGAPRFLVDTGGSDLSADTNGRFVTWTSTDALDYSFYYMDLTGTVGPQLLGSADNGHDATAISGDLVVLLKIAAGTTNPELHVLDLATGTRYSLGSTPDLGRTLPDISHDSSGNAWVTWSTFIPNSSAQDLDVWAVFFNLEAEYTVQPLFNQSRAHKAGSVVPIRLQLLDAAGVNVSSSSLVLTATGLVQQDSTANPLVVEDAGNANPDSAFRYDATLQGYAFNLSTKNLAPGTWELRFRVGGGTREYAVRFDVR